MLERSELIEATRIRTDRLEEPRGVWCGIGLSSHHVSRGLPIDVLSLVFAQEWTRRALALETSTIVIGDTNALAAGMWPIEVYRHARHVVDTLADVIDQLRFPVSIVRSSRLERSESLTRIQGRYFAPNRYVGHQLAHMDLMAKRGATLKVGWRMSASRFDERYFDRLYARQGGPEIGSIYGMCGRTLDPRRPRACPYLCSDPRWRILLRHGESIEAKLSGVESVQQPAARGYERFLRKLGRAYQRFCRPPEPEPLAALQGLLDQLAVH
jgi:hypothetical protein